MKNEDKLKQLLVSSKSDVLIMKKCAALPNISEGFKKQLWYRIDQAINAIAMAEEVTP